MSPTHGVGQHRRSRSKRVLLLMGLFVFSFAVLLPCSALRRTFIIVQPLAITTRPSSQMHPQHALMRGVKESNVENIHESQAPVFASNKPMLWTVELGFGRDKWSLNITPPQPSTKPQRQDSATAEVAISTMLGAFAAIGLASAAAVSAATLLTAMEAAITPVIAAATAGTSAASAFDVAVGTAASAGISAATAVAASVASTATSTAITAVADAARVATADVLR